jgi:hypothetical protein
MATTQFSSLVLQNEGESPSGFPVEMTPQGISIDTGFVSFLSLSILPDVLPALRLAPDVHTLKVDHTIALSDTTDASETTNTLTNGNIQINSPVLNQKVDIIPTRIEISNTDGDPKFTQIETNITRLVQPGYNIQIDNAVEMGVPTIFLNDSSVGTLQLQANNVTMFGDGKMTAYERTRIALDQTENVTSTFYIGREADQYGSLTLASNPQAPWESTATLVGENMTLGCGMCSCTGNFTAQNLNTSQYVNVNGTYIQPLNGVSGTMIDTSANRLDLGDTQSNGASTRVIIDDPQRIVTTWGGKREKVYQTQGGGEHIEPNMAFIATQYDIVFYDPSVSNYIDPILGSGDGWYCTIFNFSNGDINVSCDNSGIYFLSHANGPTQGSITVKKWATVRFTLVYEPQNYGGYMFSVSQY